MEEKTLSAIMETLRKSKCIAILDSKSKEVETNLFFPTTSLFHLYLRTLKTET
jgi:3,4-dihydroxy-2-butanone 4-phosphate synthase